MIELVKGKYYVTVQGARKLETEFSELERKRGEVAGNIRTAKAFGDLSENFEYHEAKREQGFVESRLAQLKVILPSLAVVSPEQVTTDRVGFGSQVLITDETGDDWELLIVGPLEANPLEDRISYESPLGAALFGRLLGETVEAETPAGRVSYEIVSITAYS